MTQFTYRRRTLMSLIGMLLTLLCDGMCFLFLCLRSRSALAAENLFLRKQLALCQERHVKPRHATNITRMALIWLARWFDWRRALAVIQPATLIRWHRQGFRLFWRWTSQPGRPPIPADLRALIRRMARDNPTWGEERIANELLLKLGLRVSPRTVRKYLPRSRNRPQKPGVPPQRWRTFVGIVNLMGISAKSTGEVGRRDHFEAIFWPIVGHLSVMVGVNTLGVGDVLPSTS